MELKELLEWTSEQRLARPLAGVKTEDDARALMNVLVRQNATKMGLAEMLRQGQGRTRSIPEVLGVKPGNRSMPGTSTSTPGVERLEPEPEADPLYE